MNNVRRTDSLGKNWKKQFLMTNKAKASKSKITSSHGKKNYTQNYINQAVTIQADSKEVPPIMA